MDIKITIDDTKLKELQSKLKNLPKQRETPIVELLTNDFIRKTTDFQTLQDMISASGIKNSEEIGSEEFSKFIASHSRFGNWKDMLKMATTEYIKKQLGF